MVVNGDKINFPGGATHFHNGADKYIIALAKVYVTLKAVYLGPISEILISFYFPKFCFYFLIL
jgi:hypothetical protein